MILKRFYDDKLAQASYLVGCAATGEALVVDANRDVDQYIAMAEAEGVRITHVTETHIHADYVSGSRELASRTGAQLYLSDEGDADWKYAFAESAGAELLNDGDRFQVGNIVIEAVHTPGHTPEHLSFVITDTAAADRPMGIMTGDFVFVGDVGRPDLLEKAAKVEGTMEAGARTLFRSLQKFKEYPDYIQVLPGHGAGSACGKGISSVPSSTVGYERLFNWAFQIDDEDEFVQAVLAGQPEPPKYFAEMKRINKVGPAILGGFQRPEKLADDALAGLLEKDALVVDTRPADAFGEGHVPGTLNIPLTKSFNTWAGWLVPYDRPFYLIVDDECPTCIDEAVKALAMIGLDDVTGWFGSSAVAAWDRGGREIERIETLTADQLAQRAEREEMTVVDVRGQTEWEAGHFTDVNIPVGYLPDRLDELPRDQPVVVHCQTGGRSAIAASVLAANGFDNVINLTDGYEGWVTGGHPTEKAGQGAEAAAAV